ncbi:RICIN domain-containing protein [Streptosporangium subroseum]|uniref:RICIN domain-containing protein n=1 Tax=Streptosporangium subroseum TaxID=106412 RepID=UPI003414BE94
MTRLSPLAITATAVILGLAGLILPNVGATAQTLPAQAAALAAPGVEDEGADCTVPALPDAGSLPTNAMLPDPFKKLDGTRISTTSEWRCRREEIKKLSEKFVYGEKPAKPSSVTGTVSATTITVNASNNGRSSSFSASVQLPSGTGPFPAVVVLGGFGADTAAIRAAGAAVINYDPYAVGREGTPRNNKQGAFYSIYGATSSTGLLMAWAWGVSRIIDVIEQSGGTILRADATGVTGCSRFGKGAFVIGAFDQRIALTMPIESGSAGAPIFRGIPGEGAQSLSSAYGEQPWLGDAFSTFTANPNRLPIDTHEIVAMLAPRGLFIMDNPHIANLGPRSASVAALGGAEVYKALGAASNITYWSDIQDGNHCANRTEWRTPLQQNIQKFLLKTGNAAGSIRIASKALGNLSQWRDWQTPTLTGGNPTPTPTPTVTPTPTPTPTVTPTPPGTTFQLRNDGAGRCVDSPNSASANGTLLQIYDCHTNPNQQFVYTTGKQLQTLGKCLDAPTNAGSGTRVQLWDCHTNTNQQWNLNTNGTITNGAGNLCLAVNGTTNTGTVTIATCNGQATQRWTRA